MLLSDEVKEEYCDLMFKEFFENPNVWRSSLAVTNCLLHHLNDISDSNHPEISYNAYCRHSKEAVKRYMADCDMQKFLVVSRDQVYKCNSRVELLTGTQDYGELYNKTVEEILCSRIENLEKTLHRMCTLTMIQSIDAVVYQECEEDFESLYDASK